MKLDILGHEHELVYQDNIYMCEKKVYGYHDPDANCITIDAMYNSEKQHQVLTHEILHAIADLQDVDLNEHAVRLISNGIYSVFGKNINWKAYEEKKK